MSRKAYPCIGGPLDGEYACTKDFDRGEMFEHLDGQYAQFNWGWRSWQRGLKAPQPSMIFVHNDLLKPTISPRKR